MSGNEDPTTSPGNLFQYFTTITDGKPVLMSSLNLLGYNLNPLVLFVFPVDTENNLQLPSLQQALYA